ncbi:MAG TPA: PEP/pyruvate-binding domain-containing protein [Candidatus Limnocylindria bacterium]|nr:PEP/pyruvate-binding domain-containing protein [Candidatus Limnocylindria bacterium]
MLQPSDARDRLIEWLGATDAPASVLDELLGGKGASLERLLRMGAPTPPGFCLTTTAFRHQLDASAETDAVARAIAALPDEDARSTLVRLLTDAPLAPALASALEDCVRRLASRNGGEEARFAVRSSAVGEDSRLASFAGVHETELGLTDAQVPGAIRRCWASLWSERAIQYRASRELPMDGAMAVVVQVLVPAEAAAVVFTRHPITQRDDQLLVNSVSGLGEALVSGIITPDELVLDKATLRAVSIVPANGQPVLADGELRELGTLALELEAAFRCPIDIEAALAGGKWHVLQARPITA